MGKDRNFTVLQNSNMCSMFAFVSENVLPQQRHLRFLFQNLTDCLPNPLLLKFHNI